MTREEQQLLDQLQIFCPQARIPLAEAFSAVDLDFALDKIGRSINVLLAHLIEHDKALQSLTPGGSEYVNDRARCLRVNTERRNHQASEIKELRDQLEAFTWKAGKSQISWYDPCGTVWRQPDGAFVAVFDKTDHVIKLPTVTP